jgi:hypothetical protein
MRNAEMKLYQQDNKAHDGKTRYNLELLQLGFSMKLRREHRDRDLLDPMPFS